ncbi:aspartyl protease family protein [Mucilaginibacter myungsuensis]|uniref:Aspartyl protease family protein n=1 Tax=Mucilaginibacter myungsuensis TaxID=649104 RepID=A0A929PW21_9SPHI|nr:aspartyl protease family protein [Mucilaginibacter myungsuensis]MBE9662373.1 aspartyl protease family protein [Mucilaginibacter myungsuensis]MDN3599190.1 aspartyl protease family protein [Mucilaginibacter myungsuensis]
MPVHTIPLQIIDLHGDGFHPLLDIVIYGNTFKIVLDTGASRTAFDKSMLEAHEEALISESDRLSTGLGTNEMASFTAIIPDMFIGDLHIQDQQVAVLDLSTINIAYRQLNHPEVLGVLGGDILLKYKAVIDYGKEVMKLKVRAKKGSS